MVDEGITNFEIEPEYDPGGDVTLQMVACVLFVGLVVMLFLIW